MSEPVEWDTLTTPELVAAARQIGIGEMRLVPDDLLCEVWALRELVAALAIRLTGVSHH